GDFDRLADDIDKLVPRVARGSTNITPVANSATGATVTFPPGLFTSNPAFLASPRTTVPGNTVELVSYSNVTSSSAEIYFRRTNAVVTTVEWVAVENGGGVSAAGWRKPQYEGAKNTTAR